MALRVTDICLKFLLAFCLSFPLLHTNANTLTLGMVTLTDREMENERMKPLVDYVARQLTGSPSAVGNVTFRNTNEEMIEALKSGEVDWVSETVFSALIMEQQANASIQLIRWNAEVGAYSGVIATKENSEISSIMDLNGKTIGFEDIGSTSAYFIPYIELLNHG